MLRPSMVGMRGSLVFKTCAHDTECTARLHPRRPPLPPTLTHAIFLLGTAATKNTQAAAKSAQPPLLLSFKRGKYKLNLPLVDGDVVASAERCTAFSFHPNHSLGTVKTSMRVSATFWTTSIAPTITPVILFRLCGGNDGMR